MMYTSQQGELYVGQARALGAVGVLPKLIKPVDVSKVLYQLHLLPERRDPSPAAFVPANPPAAVRQAAQPDSSGATPALPADWHAQLEAAFRNHDADLRRFVVANLDSLADRVFGDIRNYINEMPVFTQPQPSPAPRPPYAWIAAVLIALVPGIILAGLHLRALDSNRALSSENSDLRAQAANLTAEIESLRTHETQRSMDVARSGSAVAAPGIAAPIVAPVPYGEIPLALGRLDALHDLLAELEQRPFRGIVEVRTHTGRFCVVGNTSDGYALAPDDLAVSLCDLIGNPFAESLSPAQRQSLAFANLAASVRQRTGGAITVAVLEDYGSTPAAYPDVVPSLTAGQWNEIAARNNRVEFTVVPAEP
jgi:hypothetical protein